MPLLKSASKKAQSKNIATEVRAGRPLKQAVAISYGVLREAQAVAKKKKKKAKK